MICSKTAPIYILSYLTLYLYLILLLTHISLTTTYILCYLNFYSMFQLTSKSFANIYLCRKCVKFSKKYFYNFLNVAGVDLLRKLSHDCA